MKIYYLPLFAMILLLSFACSPVSKVNTETEPGVNLYQYTSFDWLDNQTSVHGNSGPQWLNERTEKSIRTAVESEMRKYGFSRCETNPDLMLHYHVVVKNEVFYIRDWWCDEESWAQYGRCHRLKPMNYQEGTLIVDMMDAKTGNQVWRGAATGAMENVSADKADSRIQEAVRLILKKLPQKQIPGFVNQ